MQVRFVGDEHRNYLICYRRRHSNQCVASYHARSFTGPPEGGELDLRDPEHAAAVAELLAAADVGPGEGNL